MSGRKGNLQIAGGNGADVHYTRIAVAFLDVVGFSALMGADERATFVRWKRLRESLVVPLLDRHAGSYIKSTGDGLIATFAAATEAVAWAGGVQRMARTRGEGLRMRIAINYGDVIIDEDGDIAGECVNIAARLEQFAWPGGIIVTREFCDQLPDPAAFDLEEAGPLKLRNIRARVEAFHVQSDARKFVGPASRGRTEARFPSIAILPFESEQAEQFFCVGMIDDLIASLSGVQEIAVIAHSTVKALAAGQSADPRELGLALGVDYIVCGVLQRAGSSMRISFELIDAATAEIVTSERAEFDVDDLFRVQDQIVERVLSRVAPDIRRATLQRALRKPPESFTAYEHMLRALDNVASLDREAFERARGHLEDAIAEDPGFANPHAWYARWRTLRVGQGWSPDPAADMAAAAESAMQATRLDRQNALALATYGHVQAYLAGDYDTAIDYLDRAVAAGPNNAIARILRSGTLSFLGRADEAQAEAEKALRLSPFDEQLFQFYGFLALAHYVGDRFDEAARWARRSLAENPNYTHTRKVLIVAMAAAGQIEAARGEARELMAREPDFRVSRYRSGRPPFKDPARVEKLIERFEAAGLAP